MTKDKPQKRSARIAGKVGIFWFYQGKILAAACALQAGEEYGDAINGLTDHVHYWPRLQHQHPELRRLEYQEVPRGRVLFLKPKQKFCIYMDKVLHKPNIKRLILEEFDLRADSTTFFTDAHYTTNPEELDRIFSPP